MLDSNTNASAKSGKNSKKRNVIQEIEMVQTGNDVSDAGVGAGAGDNFAQPKGI